MPIVKPEQHPSSARRAWRSGRKSAWFRLYVVVPLGAAIGVLLLFALGMRHWSPEGQAAAALGVMIACAAIAPETFLRGELPRRAAR